MGRGESKAAVSFRWAQSTVSELRERAARTRAGQTELTERYVIEGMRQDEHPLIHFREGPSGRRPTLTGSRLGVADVITTLRQNDNSAEETAAYLGRPIEWVRAAVAYYADYKAEIEEEIAEREAIAERERARWERQQEALA